ncbi:MAG: bifunctional glutamate N-acetyltransferase/amino-acid acetyltransferase ArgJ [Actinobacteria bacterium]|nr:bifunctional glutamate N-acetyltransferase/amino-acid acetyltransferase ArgJ [Actinomycetota bacterium]MCA1721550.1 bifunctional glutamate N-acetyltransferase/amino-acid acetyltransferase ArgJ [Actinomycetota bacterium]
MSVTAAKGFRAAGVAAGLKSSGNPDVALVVNDGPARAAAAVFTSNRFKANPVLWSEQVVKDGRVRAVVLNSGGANCGTGAAGFQTTHATAERVAELLQDGAADVVVCSTGLIGPLFNRDRLLAGVDAAAALLTNDGGPAAATAIMTTDTVSKQAVATVDGMTVGGMAKGAGMLAPALATMLVVITTDADVDAAACDRALRSATRTTFDRLDSDGCQSTNDTVLLMASGASGVQPEPGAFDEAVRQVCQDLALQLLSDAEGSAHDITIEVTGAASEDDAVEVGRSIARSNLFKCAVFGEDPNWGRVLASVGTTSAEFDVYALDVTFNGVQVCRAGEQFEDPAKVAFDGRAVHLLVDLHAGDATATIRTNDLTTAYVHENSAYST